MRWSVGAMIVSFLFLSMALLALPAGSQKKREPLVETVSPVASPAPTGPASGAMVQLVLDWTLKTPVQPIRGRKVAAHRVRSCEKIPERAKASRAEAQRRRARKEKEGVVYFEISEPPRLCARLFIFSQIRELWVMFQEITTPALGSPLLLNQEGSYPKHFRPLGLET